MSAHVHKLPDTNLPPFTGGGSWMIGSAAVGVLGLLLTLLGGVFGDAKAALLAYLIAYVYFLGLALGAISLVMANNAAGARWNVVIRRIGETLGATMPLFVVLFLPLVFWAKRIWFWMDPPAGLPKAMLEVIRNKHAYLNYPGFIVRAGVYFLVFNVLALLLRRWSVRQDETGEALLTLRQRTLSAPGLVFATLAITFASFDWLMSLQPTWYSTIFGLYIYAGAFIASLALIALIITGLRARGTPLGLLISVDQQHNVGKLMLAFIAFWAYMAFSQYMLIWAGNLPDEISWIIVRSKGVWRPVGQLILVMHFLVPFFLLLSRDLKRSAPALAMVAGLILFIHYVDLYWVVMPAASLDSIGLHWTHFTAFVGVGGLSAAAALFALRGVRPVPVKDPFLADSLRYVQP